MKFIVGLLIQLAGILAQYGNQALDWTPEKHKPLVTAFIAAVTGLAGIVAFFYNPNGTSARLPYVPNGGNSGGSGGTGVSGTGSGGSYYEPDRTDPFAPFPPPGSGPPNSWQP